MARAAKATNNNGNASEMDAAFARVAKAFVKDREVSHGKMFASMGLKVNGPTIRT
jgi:hypothetical protein